MFKRKKTPLQKILENTPEGHMFVSDTIIAVPMPEGKCIVIAGGFRDITAEEANLKLQNAIAKLN